MKIGFDLGKYNKENNFRGIGSYTNNLLEELKKHKEIEVSILKDGKENVDLIHIPFFDFYQRSLNINNNVPTLVTIFDTIPLLFPKHYPAGLKAKFNLLMQKRELKKSRGIITISNAAKSDIHKILNYPSERIYPIYLAASNEYKVIKDKGELKKVKDKYNLPEKFAIFIGNVNWNKNLVNLTQACINSNTHIVLVGKSFSNRENLDHPELKSYKEFLDKFSGSELVHILSFIETNDLVKILNLSEVLLLPSFYEGFGITILEAQSCGVPVITSNVSSMPEVSGDSAILVNPNSVKDISENINKVIENDDLRNKLIKKGFENIKRFSWEKTAEQTIEIYRKILDV